VPAITDSGPVPTLTVDETTLGTANTVDFSGAFTVIEGADGATVEYSLAVDSSIPTGLTDTATGQTIVLSVNAAGAFHNNAALEVRIDRDDTSKRPVAGSYTDTTTLTVGPV